ncbi:MAG: TetR/AcrR family transcriptional regulator [Mycobacteriaceae bacterium]
MKSDTDTRSYAMGARQVAKDATREVILRAAIDAFMAERSFDITLPSVATRAGVTVKTVLRHFGNREALIDAAWSQAYRDIVDERTPPAGDSDEALRVLIAHYDSRGEVVLAMLANEHDPRAARANSTGRLAHRAWVQDVFEARLPAGASARSRVVDVLVVATDVYAWKLLRLDRGLSADDVHDRFALMTDALLAEASA